MVRNNDTETLQYEIYLNDDESEAIVFGRFGYVAALIERSEHLGALGRRTRRRER